MSVEQIVEPSPPPVVEVLTARVDDTVEELLLSIARGSPEALAALQTRMAGLVRVNVRRVLRDASRCEAITTTTFAELLEDAVDFDPGKHNAQTWLLTRAHQHAMDGLEAVAGTSGLQDRKTETTPTDAPLVSLP